MTYKILSQLGRGATSKVYLALDPVSGKQVAVKTANMPMGDAAGQYLQNESTTLGKLDHPNVIKLFADDGNPDEKDQSLVLEYAQNGELFKYIRGSGVLQESMARHFFKQLVEGVEYIHCQGFAHRDLKLENLLLDECFSMKIADFGFSCVLDNRKRRGVIGTKPYMAPEIIRMQHCDLVSCDIFAIGVTLFTLVAGFFPFECASKENRKYQLIEEENWDEFWKSQEESSTKENPIRFSRSFKSLFERLVCSSPEKRLTTNQIKASEWYKRASLAPNIVRAQMVVIKRKLESGLMEAEKENDTKYTVGQ